MHIPGRTVDYGLAAMAARRGCILQCAVFHRPSVVVQIVDTAEKLEPLIRRLSNAKGYWG